MSSALRRPLAYPLSRSITANPGRIRVIVPRYISTSRPAFNTASPSAEAPKPKKKRRIIRTTLLYSTLLVLTAYGAGTAAAVNNEQAHDFFTNNVPLGEELVDLAESYGFVGGLPRAATEPGFTTRRQRPTPSTHPAPEPPKEHEKLEKLKSKVEARVQEKKERLRGVVSQLPTKAEKGPRRVVPGAEISDTLPAPLPPAHYSEGVEDLVNEVKTVLKGDPVVAGTRAAGTTVASTIPNPPRTKPDMSPGKEDSAAPPIIPPQEHEQPKSETEKEPVPPPGKQFYDGPALPLGFEPPAGFVLRPPKKIPKTDAGLLLVAPAVKEFTGSEPLLQELATQVDGLAHYLESNPKAAKSANKVLEVAKKDLEELGKKIKKVETESKEELEKSLDQQAAAYTAKLVEAEMSAQDKLDSQDEEWRKYFDQERMSLLQKYQEKLDNELSTQKDLINERLKEEVIAQGIELQRRWIRDVQLHVEEERGGRLAKVEEVASGLKKLERLTLDNAQYLDENLRLHAVWSALRALTNATIESSTRQPFRDQLHVLKNVATAAGAADDTVTAAVKSLETSDAPDVGLEPLADLTTWFTSSVVPRVSSVSLVPDYGGGVLVHLASSLLSTLRFKPTGLVQGTDALSVIARAEYYLNEKDLDSATRELNQLQGPAKELLKDWLAAARRRLEVEQAIEVMRAQATLSSLLVL